MSNESELNQSNGVSASTAGNSAWGPYANRTNSNIKDCYVHVVHRGTQGNPLYKNLDDKFLVGIDTQGCMRFICDMPDPASIALPMYKMADIENNAEEVQRLERHLNDIFCDVVKIFG